MKSLKNIQILAKVGKILSKIVFIFGVVAVCVCVVGLALLPFGDGKIAEIGGVTINGIVDIGTEEGRSIAYITFVFVIITCIGNAMLAKFAERYFYNELKAGTPFTENGSKELLNLGILTIVIPIATSVAAEIVRRVMLELMNISDELAAAADASYDNGSSVALGVMFIIMSLFCSYGASLADPSHKDRPVKELI